MRATTTIPMSNSFSSPVTTDDLWTRGQNEFLTHGALPLPGSGHTIERWSHLARIAGDDVCLAKLLEAHHDAAAILAELGSPSIGDGELWAVWASEPPDAVVRVHDIAGRSCRISGTKAWCSGASLVTHALVTAVDGDARALVAVRLDDQGISPPCTQWDAIGMSRIVSGPLSFESTPAQLIGGAGDYLSRPGFWHGGGGIAACWFGAAVAIAETLRTHRRVRTDTHAATHLGAIDIALCAAAALLRETAAAIDRSPCDSHRTAVIRVRSKVERVALDVIDRVGRALGPAPLCNDRAHAQRCADLAVFVRQSHAERDWESLGHDAHADSPNSWQL